jgi:mRNA interferase YafQ
MRRIKRSSVFKRDYKKAKASPRHSRDVGPLLAKVLTLLAEDHPLPASNRDHALAGEWNGHRECHIEPDLLLIYRKPDNETLHLVRLGSHSDLF